MIKNLIIIMLFISTSTLVIAQPPLSYCPKTFGDAQQAPNDWDFPTTGNPQNTFKFAVINVPLSTLICNYKNSSGTIEAQIISKFKAEPYQDPPYQKHWKSSSVYLGQVCPLEAVGKVAPDYCPFLRD